MNPRFSLHGPVNSLPFLFAIQEASCSLIYFSCTNGSITLCANTKTQVTINFNPITPRPVPLRVQGRSHKAVGYRPSYLVALAANEKHEIANHLFKL